MSAATPPPAHDPAAGPPTRVQTFPGDGPVAVTVEMSAGRLDIQLIEPEPASTDARHAAGPTVQIRPDPGPATPWSGGLAGVLSWLSEQAEPGAHHDTAAQAADRTEIDFDGHLLTVRTPREAALRTIPLQITVTAPSGSTVAARTGAADVTVDGRAARIDTATGSGDVRLEGCHGPVDVRTGSGDVGLGPVHGPLRARTGSGTVDLTAVHDGGRVETGSGAVRVGTLEADLHARTASGDLTVADAASGAIELSTGSGRLHVGVRSGVLAEIDLHSASGSTRSELAVGPRPEGTDEPALRIRGRTGSGDALVATGAAAG